MLLTVYCVRRDLSEVTFSLQVDADFELHNFRALCELESGIPAAESQIVYAERPLTDNHRSLASYGLKDGDVVILRQKENAEPRPAVHFPGLPRIDFRSIAVPGTSGPRRPPPAGAQQPRLAPGELGSSPQGLDNPALLRDMLLANPHELALLKERNPPLADALLSGDLEKFSRVLVEQQQDRARREQERIRLFSADPFDLEAQARIEEDIRQQNIEENMTIAMEEAPESFGQVVMLYINCKVNGHPVKAFVDSGAQMTIMSQACAERCNIMRLVDRRWAGIAKGVGTQKIIGRVHLAQVQIEGDFLPCSFSILEEQPMDMLLGLDMLKRHQCSIDLKKNVLVIGTTGSQTAFLPEGELPECARLAYGAGREESADRELAEALQKSVEDAEKSGQETTSPGTSSPTSDGSSHPTHPSGRSPRTGDPAGPARSASASLCPATAGDPGSVRPEASCEPARLPVRDSAPPLRDSDSPGEAAAAAGPRELPPAGGRSAHGAGPRSPHTRRESGLLGTAARMQEPWDSPGGGFRCPERRGPGEGGGRLAHRGAGSEQLRSTEDLDAQPRGPGDTGAVATACSCSDSETLMEVDAAATGQAPVAEPDPAGREEAQEAGGKSEDGPALGPDDLPMEVEVEASKCGRSVPESRVAVSGTSDGRDGCQPSAESTEDSCSSLTAALKELHGLLVISSKTTASGSNTSEEITRRPEAGAEDRPAGGDRSQRRAQGEQRARSSIAAAGTEATHGMDLGAAGGGLSIAKAGVSESGEPGTEGGSVAPASSQMSRQPQSTLGAEMPPAPTAEEEEGALAHTCEPAGWASSGSGLARDPGQGTQAAGPRLELPTPVFPAADIERILRAGFTLQEALGALHRVGGNADLALLVLLAKNIVVPT